MFDILLYIKTIGNIKCVESQDGFQLIYSIKKVKQFNLQYLLLHFFTTVKFLNMLTFSMRAYALQI